MSIRRGNKFSNYEAVGEAVRFSSENIQCYRRKTIKLKVVGGKGICDKPGYGMNSLQFNLCLKDYLRFPDSTK